MDNSCMNLTISREGPQISGQLTGLQAGIYTVRKVAEVEKGGEITVHGITDVLELYVAKATPTTSFAETSGYVYLTLQL